MSPASLEIARQHHDSCSMGQYYHVVNLDKAQYIHPHRMGDGLKLLEFGSSGDGTMLALAVLLAEGNGRGGGDLYSSNNIIGSWAGDRIVVAGDYADENKFLDDYKHLVDKWHEQKKAENPEWYEKYGHKGPNLYDISGEYFVDVSEDIVEALVDDQYFRNIFREKRSFTCVGPAVVAAKEEEEARQNAES